MIYKKDMSITISEDATNDQKLIYNMFMDIFPHEKRNIVKDNIFLTSNATFQYKIYGKIIEWIIVYIGSKDEIYRNIMDIFLGTDTNFILSNNLISSKDKSVYSKTRSSINHHFRSVNFTIECCIFNNENQYYTNTYINAVTKCTLQCNIPNAGVAHDIAEKYLMCKLTSNIHLTNSIESYNSKILTTCVISHNISLTKYNKTTWITMFARDLENIAQMTQERDLGIKFRV